MTTRQLVAAYKALPRNDATPFVIDYKAFLKARVILELAEGQGIDGQPYYSVWFYHFDEAAQPTMATNATFSHLEEARTFFREAKP